MNTYTPKHATTLSAIYCGNGFEIGLPAQPPGFRWLVWRINIPEGRRDAYSCANMLATWLDLDSELTCWPHANGADQIVAMPVPSAGYASFCDFDAVRAAGRLS